MNSDLKEQENETKNFRYQGNGFPWFLKLIWILFIAWSVYYMVVYSFPDFGKAPANPSLEEIQQNKTSQEES